jgi:divalent metal cation (Fe/Co/Zn/Cd) transporter
MDENLHQDLIEDIRKHSKEVDGIIETEKCYVRKAGLEYHLDLHAIVDAEISVREGHRLAHDLKDALINKIPNLGFVSIHIEPDE